MVADPGIRTFAVIAVANVLLALTSWFTLTDVLIITSMFMLCWCLLMLCFMMLQNHRWMVIMMARLRGHVPVELVDHEGARTYTMALPCDGDRMTAPVYWFSNIGRCMLEPNGLVDRESESCYMYFWLPLDQKQRTLHVMTHDVPDLGQLAYHEPAEKRRIMREMLAERGG